MTKIYENEEDEEIDVNTIQRIRLHVNPKNAYTLIDTRNVIQMIGTGISGIRDYSYFKQKDRKMQFIDINEVQKKLEALEKDKKDKITQAKNVLQASNSDRKNRMQNDLKMLMTRHPLKIFLYHTYPHPMIKCKTLLSGNNIFIERPNESKDVNIFKELNLFDYQNLIKIDQKHSLN